MVAPKHEGALLTMSDVAILLGVSRSAVKKWRKLGYEPEFGRHTSIEHVKDWLRSTYKPMLAAKRAEQAERERAQLEAMR